MFKPSHRESHVFLIGRKIIRLSQKRLVRIFFSGVMTLFFWLSLASYSPTDSSYFYYATHGVVTNWCASAGAHLAAFLIYFFGISAWLFAVWSSYLVYYYIGNHKRSTESRDRLLVLFAAPCLSALFCSWYHYEIYASTLPGGLFGALTQRILVYFFDKVGAWLILHASLLALMFIAAPRLVWYSIHKLMSAVRALCSRSTVMFILHIIARGMMIGVAGTRMLTRFVMRALQGSPSVLGHEQTILTFEKIDISDTYVPTDDPFWLQSHQSAHQEQVEKSDVLATQEIEIIESEMKSRPMASYVLPYPSLLAKPMTSSQERAREEVLGRAALLEHKLERFGIQGKVMEIKEGPVVTLFEYEPSHDTKLSKIVVLEDDLAMALQALSIRIIAPIPGRSVVGFEVANKKRSDVPFATILHSQAFQEFKGSIPLILGCDTVGTTIIVDLAKMPHMLVAGSTGSGKSVALNTMLMSMLCARTPDELKLILIDPKRLEFTSYADIPHLIFPIVTDPRKAAPVLQWVVRTMQERYEKMAVVGVRNSIDYNRVAKNNDKIPFIVVVIDELADLMMTAAREVEDLIARIAQMARAAGIHLLVATQRPSVDIITGLIKVNFPSRISFRVTSKVDSRTILDSCGAEKLLGCGDMLFLDGTSTSLKRAHGAYVSDKEIATIVSYVKSQRSVTYLDATQEISAFSTYASDVQDQMFGEVLTFVRQCDAVSISLLQRRFKIGFNRSARIIDQLEAQGIIMPAENGKTRKVINS